ncbi:unnamed protein product [Rotaria sordida]|uniref:Uncharacterized protein n=2 Tax=Rotaria sordida TaxID=392033 RepID=A0A813RPE5_9BILA|nr:unnamed protein product [Rotaria sordida]
MSKTTAIVSSGFSSSSLSPPTYTLAVVSVNPLSGKSSLCKRLIDSNIDNYQLFSLKNNSINKQHIATWFYWGTVRHRRSDEKREALFHLIEHSTIAIDDNEQYDNYIKRITSLTLRPEEKFQNDSDYPQIKTFPKDKITIDAFLCIHDLSSSKQISELLFLLHSLFKTRRPVLIITTKNDLIENQSDLALQFEQSIRCSSSNDSQFLLNIPIIHTSANEHINIQAILEVALYACDEPILLSSRKSSHSNILMSKYIPPTYKDAYINEQSLKHVIQTEYKTLLARHVLDFRLGSWIKFYTNWQHHTSIQTFIDMFGKQQAERLYNEHIDELQRISRQKLIDERLIPIVELLVTDQKTKLSRNWDYVRLQMQKHPRYSSTVIPSSMWSDSEHNKGNQSLSLIIPDDILDTVEARLRFESYINSRQLEQTRRANCRSFFDLLNRFSDAGLVQYGHSYEKDCVYFLGRECYESLNAQDRLRIFAFHQSYLYRLLCLKFVELLLESFEIFTNTFQKMNSATTNKLNNDRKMTTLTIDDIFEKEIIQQIKHDSRYQALNNRETDRHRLIMCHCHFLYDCIYYSPTRNLNRLLKQRKRSFKRRKSSLQSLYSHHINIDENFCPYTRKFSSHTNENEGINKKKFEIGCPMEETCADVRIMNEFFSLTPLKKNINKNILICGNENDMNNCLRLLSKDSSLINEFQINLWTLNNVKTQAINGCLIVSLTGQEILEEFISQKRFPINIDTIPIVHLNSQIPNDSNNNIPHEITIEQLRSSLEQLLSNEKNVPNKNQFDLRILLCFMCGGENNDVENFFSQLSSRFSLMVTNQHGELSFIINAFLGRSNRKIQFIPVSFHSVFTIKLIDFDGFILFYDQDRKAAVNTMTYLEKHISTTLQNELLKKADDNTEMNGTKITHPPICILSCTKDLSLSNIKKYPQTDYSIQSHHGTIRNFVESHLSPFLNQCWTEKNGNTIENDYYRKEKLLVGVTSYFDRATHSSANDLMTSSLERTRKQLVNNSINDRAGSLVLSTKSNEHSPRHQSSLLTPTNHEQMFSYRSYPYLSISNNGAESTIVPTTPVDPCATNLGLISPSSISTSSISDSQHQQFKKSTSMRFAKLMEHPINYLTFNADGTSYQSSPSNANKESSLTKHRQINEISSRLSSSEDMKFHLYKHRTAPQVKVPLATPEIIEFNESIATPFSIKQYPDTSLVLTNNHADDIPTVNSSSSSPPTIHQQHQNHSSTIDESITDSSKQTRATDSSVDSSSDENIQDQVKSSTTLHNINSSTNNQQQNQATLQRKVSDRKSKRVRAKQNDVTGLTSSTEALKKIGSDDEILVDDDKRLQQPCQKKKHRPSFKRRKKAVYDQTQTDSGIDSRMELKNTNKVSITPEPTSSSNVVISNEDDSSIGDYTKDSKNTSIEELEERPTANWIRRQLQYFAQARRDKNDVKTRSPAATITTISSPPLLSFKATMTSTPSITNTTVSPLSSVENSHHHTPLRLSLSRCIQSNKSGVPLFIEKCIQFIEEYGLAVEGLYRVSGYKNQVELVINKLTEDPSYDLRLLQVPASAVATALKDMMRKLDEPLLSLELFDECKNLTSNQLREQNFISLRKALSRTSELEYRTIKFIFKHLHFVSQHAASTHMDSSNLAVLWWPNLFQPQFRDLRTAEQTCQQAKPLIQAIIDNYSIIFSSDEIK